MPDEINAHDFFNRFDDCPLCIEFNYFDTEGKEHIVLELCEFHRPIIEE